MARNDVSSDRKRLTVVLPERSVRRLNALVERTEASSYTEVLKNALRLYEALVDEAEKGREILIREEDGRLKSYQIFLLAFSDVRRWWLVLERLLDWRRPLRSIACARAGG